MYRVKEAVCMMNEDPKRVGERRAPKTKKEFFNMETLLNLTETLATMAMAAGFLLMVAAMLAAL